MEYGERYFAFIDVLGFSELIAAIRRCKTECEKAAAFNSVKALLQAVHSPSSELNQDDHPADFRSQSISDAVAVSAAVNRSGLLMLLDSIEKLALQLLSEGYFIRGAIVRGPLYHDDNMVFGEALIRAYQLESQIVRFPRIMVERAVAKEIDDYRRDDGQSDTTIVTPPFQGRILQAEDGPMYLNILRGVILDFEFPTMPEHRHNWLEMREQIIKRLEEAIDSPRHFEKVQWFAQYWNKVMVEGPPRVGGIRFAGIEPSKR